MRKKSLKIITCLFAIAFLFMGGTKVQAIDTIVKGDAAKREKDPCKTNSYVCIRALSAVRISYYDEGVYQRGKDFYNTGSGWNESNVGIDLINKKAQNLKQLSNKDIKNKITSSKFYDTNKKGKHVSGVAFANLAKNSHAVISINSSFYSNMLEKLSITSLNLNLIKTILAELDPSFDYGWGEKKVEKYLRKHPNGKLLIEPLFVGQVQSIQDVNNNANTFKAAIGTSYNIAHFACNDSNRKNAVYCDRSEKGHIMKMANSMYIPKGETGTLEIPGVHPAARNKTKMSKLKEVNGYGSAVVSFKKLIKKPESTSTKYGSKCYQITNDNNCDEECDTNKGTSAIEMRDDTIVDETKVKKNKSCIGSIGKTAGKYSHSTYGVDKGTINEYCHIYCNVSNSFSYKAPTGGNNNFNILFGTDHKTSEFQTAFELLGSSEYKCKVDFVYDYNLKDIDVKDCIDKDKGTITEGKKKATFEYIKETKECALAYSLIDQGRTTVAESDLAMAWNKYHNKKKRLEAAKAAGFSTNTIASFINAAQAANTAYKNVLNSVRGKMAACGGVDISKEVDVEIDAPELYYENEKLNVVEVEDSSIKTCESCVTSELGIAKDYSEICNGQKCSKAFGCKVDEDAEDTEYKITISSGLCALQRYYEEEISMFSAATIKASKTFTSNSSWKYDWTNSIKTNTNPGNKVKIDEDDKININTVGKINSDASQVCKSHIKGAGIGGSPSSSDSGDNDNNGGKNASLTTTFKVKAPQVVCKNTTCETTVEMDSGQANCACSSDTLHKGESAYTLLDKLNKLDVEGGSPGFTCSEAMRQVCNDSTIEPGSGYEPTLGDDESGSIDGCLSYGIPYQICYYAPWKAYCTNGYGNSLVITSQVWNYISQHKEYLDRINKADTDEERKSVFDEATKKASKEIQKCNCDSNSGPVVDYQYRTIKLGTKAEAFPGVDGKGRVPGWNWRSDSDIKQYITDTKDVYSKKPMYTITLTPATVRRIRGYNRSHPYGDFNLSCMSGSNCISSFLRGADSILTNVKGKCANVGKSDFNSCVNH